jgi:hypothetical protein
VNEIEIADVTPERMEKIGRFLKRSGVTGFSGDQGTVKGDCFAAEYRYDPAARLLVVQVSRLPEAFQKAPEAAVIPAFQGLVRHVMVGRKPNNYGVYDYVIPNIDNQSGGTITYSSSDPTNGTISISNSKITSGSGSQEAFEADSSKLSGTGVGGTCNYTLADGQTVLAITYFLNTIYTHTFTVGLQGANAARYQVSTTDTNPSLDGYTYLTPTTTLAKA